MSVCCNPVAPKIIWYNETPAAPQLLDSGASVEVNPLLAVPESPLSGSGRRRLSSVPSTAAPLRDVKELLLDLGSRHENFFRQVLNQQKELSKQLVAVQLTATATAEAQSTLQKCQERLAVDVRQIHERDLAEYGKKTHGGVDKEEKDIMHPEVNHSWRGTEHSVISDLSHANHRHSSAEERSSTLYIPNTLSKDQRDATTGRTSHVRQDRKSNYPGLQLTRKWFDAEIDDSYWSFFKNMLKCKEFEIAIAFAIIVNALVISAESQYQGLEVGFNLQFPGRRLPASLVWQGAETAFRVCDWSFGIIFFFEMLAKLVCWQRKYFYDAVRRRREGPDPGCIGNLMGHCRNIQVWNVLDFCCVAAFLFDKMAQYVLEIVVSVNPQMLRLLRLFRLLRLVRLLRWLETFDHLYVMATAITSLGVVLIWAIILLALMLLICNLFLVQILQASYFNKVTASDLTEESLRRHHMMYEYFGTCTRCMLSMFEITLGNWPPVARLLSEEVSEWFSLIMVLHKLTIGFAVVGVITGIILQETFKIVATDDIIMFRQKKKTARILKNKMNILFDTLDTERDGRVNMKEFCAIGDDHEIQIWLASLQLETDDLANLFSLIDYDNSGFITLDELICRIPRIQGGARSLDMLTIMKKLHLYGPAERSMSTQQKKTLLQ